MSKRKRIFVNTGRSGMKGKKSSLQIARSNRVKIGQIKSGIETKYFYTNRVFSASAVGEEQDPLNDMGQGTTDETRIGSRITLKGLNVRFFCNTSATGILRFLVVLDRQNNGGTTTTPVEDLFRHVATESDSCFSVYDNDLVGPDKRYSILFDSGTVFIDGDAKASYYKSVKLRLGHKVLYDGNTPSSADIVDKCISTYVIANNTSTAWGMSARISYVDL